MLPATGTREMDNSSPFPTLRRTRRFSLRAWALGIVFVLMLSQALLAPALCQSQSFAVAPSFASVPWGSSQDVVRQDLQTHGYTFVKRDGDGDLWFSGTVDFQKAQVIEILSRSGLVKTIVHLLTPDSDCRNVYEETVNALETKYGVPSSKFSAYDYPFNDGTGDDHFETAVSVGKAHFSAFWFSQDKSSGIYVEIAKNLTVSINYESTAWSAEMKRRQTKVNQDL